MRSFLSLTTPLDALLARLFCVAVPPTAAVDSWCDQPSDIQMVVDSDASLATPDPHSLSDMLQLGDSQAQAFDEDEPWHWLQDICSNDNLKALALSSDILFDPPSNTQPSTLCVTGDMAELSQLMHVME